MADYCYELEAAYSDCTVDKNRAVWALKEIAGWTDKRFLQPGDRQQLAGRWLKENGYQPFEQANLFADSE